MSWDEAAAAQAAAVFEHLGATDGTYHSFLKGEVTLDASAGQGVLVNPSYEVFDEPSGMYARVAVASVPAGLFKPESGDWIEQANGKRWTVEQVLDGSDDHILELRVTPRP